MNKLFYIITLRDGDGTATKSGEYDGTKKGLVLYKSLREALIADAELSSDSTTSFYRTEDVSD